MLDILQIIILSLIGIISLVLISIMILSVITIIIGNSYITYALLVLKHHLYYGPLYNITFIRAKLKADNDIYIFIDKYYIVDSRKFKEYNDYKKFNVDESISHSFKKQLRLSRELGYGYDSNILLAGKSRIVYSKNEVNKIIMESELL